ncbi:MAG: Flp family type IVb pilin [Terracidiphilus sp.]|jgi:Flp pilus assembly pilin Flp
MRNGVQELYLKFLNLRYSEEAQDLVEYALLLTIISLALITAMNGIASAVSKVFTDVSTSLA